MRKLGGVRGAYGHINDSIRIEDRVTVINHGLWFRPHQGISTQEVEALNGTTLTKA